MLRKGLVWLFVAAFMSLPVAAAAEGGPGQNAPQPGSSGKRVMWTIIGAAAGFGAGVFIGLNQFDDAVNSDQKVWTTALVSAAAGGVAGNLLSRNVGSGTAKPEVRTVGRPEGGPRPVTSWNTAVSGAGLLTPPSRR